ncbi:hypothetical protein GCM10007350_09940 [Jeongeupia chitinilytica]|uniref:Uncharacterized protein n=1 Tax=Jeongeupia chitinilytica TaxID=1041641 RepID=A0ABQ3GYT3_9NEIS|nr:hypothetical protein GCM10007350_09940 [Jeongeupia chitinilytica]
MKPPEWEKGACAPFGDGAIVIHLGRFTHACANPERRYFARLGECLRSLPQDLVSAGTGPETACLQRSYR